jgi:hypothetical protein
MFRMKKGAQHRTKVKKTRPKTLDAFCSVATALAARERLLFLPAKNLDVVNTLCLTKDMINYNSARSWQNVSSKCMYSI